MTTQEDLLGALSVTETDAIKRIISRTPFVYLGVISEVVSEGIVKVVPSVIGSEKEFFEVDCVLATIASQSLAIKVVPHVGDKVRVYSPMNYSNKMFLKSNDGTLLAENSRGYSVFTGIAVLENQFQNGTHLNIITIDDGKIEANLAYDSENNVNNLQLTVGADGEVTVKNPNATVTIGADGNVTVSTSGKYVIKNEDTDLLTVFKELKGVLEQFKTVGSPSTQSTSPDTITALGQWETNHVEKLLAEGSEEQSDGSE